MTAYRVVGSYGLGGRIPLVLDGRVVAEVALAELLPEGPSS
jgi:hypothetical protein